MPDLSKLLGDVYQTTTTAEAVDERPDPEPVDREAKEGDDEPDAPLPDWADDEVLDRAFASWVPGPSDDAPAAERAMATEVDETSESTATSDGSAEAAVDPEPNHDAEPEVVPAVPAVRVVADTAPPVEDAAEPGAWSRQSDDILPGKRSRR